MLFLQLALLPPRLEWRLPYRRLAGVCAMSREPPASRMNLNEYMVTLENPLRIRFAIAADDRVYAHALKRGVNAEKSRMIMVGDTSKKAGDSADGAVVEIKDFGDTESMLASNLRSPERSGSSGFALFSPKFLSPSAICAEAPPPPEIKDANIVKVIERPLTESERFMLAKAA